MKDKKKKGGPRVYLTFSLKWGGTPKETTGRMTEEDGREEPRALICQRHVKFRIRTGIDQVRVS